ncbi:MAG: penicillin-binding protein activator LpoB [Cryomorphaceae bacterium]|jgi:hypothetical protein|nr:penicillin-binding protein activator LpoB [Cryomorphaceae bacterium]
MKTKKLQSFYILVAIFFSGMASYFAQQSNTIAVANPNVNALTIKPESVAKMMRLELIKINKYKVYDEFDMNEVIKAKEEYKVGCYGQSCLARLGEELKVDYVMSGSIDGLGNKIVITIKIIDVKGQALYKSSVREFDNQETEVQRMVEVVLAEMHGLTVDKLLTDRLAFKNELITSNNVGKVNNSGPRIGFAYLTGSVNEFATRATKYGGLGIQPFTSMIGYQIEGQYVGTENFSALVEGIINISGLEQGQFVPSISLLNGFRFGKANWEFAFGPRFGISSTSEGFFDDQNIFSTDARYFSQSDWSQYAMQNNLNPVDPGNGYIFEKNFDRRGDKAIATTFLIAFGRTFQAGALNIPVNLFYSSQKGGGYVGVNMGFNVQKSKQPINKQSPQRYY